MTDGSEKLDVYGKAAEESVGNRNIHSFPLHTFSRKNYAIFSDCVL